MTDSLEPISAQESVTPPEPVLFADSAIRGFLVETSKWGKFLAILGYIGLGIMICAALVMMFLGSLIPGTGSALPTSLFGLIYLVFAALYFVPVHQLYLFSASIREAVEMNLQDRFTEGFSHLKTLFRFLGILSIVVIGFYILLLLFVLPMAMMVAP
ncbi:MAG: hypothetical protein HUU10_11145 [Bacteroidetes bacterium]|nr:hypothetical protein [Bacteroidota bacterium]